MLKVKPFRQKTGFCGPASLKMVLGFFAVDITEKDLGELSGATSEKGATARQIVRAAEKLGFYAEIKDNCEITDIHHFIHAEQIPVIVDWFYEDDGHYSVAVDIDRENIYLQDPSFGHLRAMRLPVFKRVWFDFTGEYLQSKDDLIIRRLIIIRSK